MPCFAMLVAQNDSVNYDWGDFGGSEFHLIPLCIHVLRRIYNIHDSECVHNILPAIYLIIITGWCYH